MENKDLINLDPEENENGNENAVVNAAEVVDELTAAEQTAEHISEVKNQLNAEDKELILDLIQSDRLPESAAGEFVKVEDVDETSEIVSSDSVEAESVEETPAVDVVSAEETTPEVESVVESEVQSETESVELGEPVVAEVQAVTAVESEHLLDEETVEEYEAVSEHDFAGLNKLQLVEMLEETVTEQDVAKIKSKVAAIKVYFLKLNKEDIDHELDQFIADGGEKESFEHHDDPLEVRFKTAFSHYKENKSKHNELLEKQKQQNLVQKLAILDELKTLISSEETLKKTYDEFKILQDKWKEIGQVPAGEITNLWNNYHFLVEKFFDKVKINRELRDLDMKKNLEAKIEICEKTEELLLEESVIKAFKLLQKYHDDWKEIGPVPQDVKEEVWERFKIATDKINAIRRDHYSKIQEEQQHNYEAKVALCEKAEEIVSDAYDSINIWMKKSDEMRDLFKVWRSVGQAPKKQNDEVWNRFKLAMDNFFETKKDYFGKLKDQQLENYNRKLDLCVQAEALLESNEWRKATDQFKALQEEWKNIGPVPRKNSDKIWKRFRGACDEFFRRKSEHFSGIRGREDENLQKKKDLIDQIAAFEVKADRSANLDALKALQRTWMEIGHVPIKVKDQLYADYRKAIDKLFEKMKLTEQEMATTHYRSSIDHMRDEPDSGDKIRRERMTLATKVTKLKEEIMLLENNIGFFSSSKQADIMRAEYEKKISKAKSEVKLLEAKLKMLKD